MTTLPEKIVAIDGALTGVPHAFGGALALAYYAEPRATIDIDVNVFVPVAEAPAVLERLRGLGVAVDGPLDTVAREGQVRLWWERNPIDVFFSYDPFHDAARDAARTVPFADTEIPVLGADHLVVCKVVFDRPKDWVDIDALLGAGTALDAGEVLRWVSRIAGPDDPRFARIARVLAT